MKSFKGGIYLPDYKNTKEIPIYELPLPGKVIIPLLQHVGNSAEPVVKIGEAVKTGQLIGEAKGQVSACIHASISGKVLAISKYSHLNGMEIESVIIESDGKNDQVSSFLSKKVEDFTKEEILACIKKAGIVGLGGAAFPTHVKLDPPSGEKIDTLILNSCECEPYLTCDDRVIMEYMDKILLGLQLMMKVLQVEQGYIAIENHKISLEVLKDKILPDNIKVSMLKTKYPQGAEKQLIKSILGREVPSGKLPFDVGCIVHNVQTAKAVYDAVYENKPLYERIITVAGRINKPGNYKVRIGTLLTDIVDYCGGLNTGTLKIIMGGPMMGITQTNLKVPVIKGTSGIVILSDKEVKSFKPSNCVRCGRCIEVCPMGLVPTMISRLVEKGLYDEMKDFHPLDCMECGCCTYECPAKQYLVQNIRLAKSIMHKNKH